jgi:hypothetical protein
MNSYSLRVRLSVADHSHQRHTGLIAYVAVSPLTMPLHGSRPGLCIRLSVLR